MSDRDQTVTSAPGEVVVRWALVGSSDFAVDWIAPAIARTLGNELAAVVSADSIRARSAADVLGVSRSGGTLQEILDAGIDAVHVCTPNPTHADITRQALTAGCHVLVEKPMAATVAACRTMIEAAQRAQRLLAVGHCMNWAPPLVAARQAIDAGAIGQPLLASIALGFDSPPSGLWRQDLSTEEGGGPLFDLGSHAADALLTLFGPVQSVSASLRRLRHPYAAEDTAVVLVDFEDGATATMQVSFAAELNSLSIVGTEGELVSTEWRGREFNGNLTLRSPGGGVGSFSAGADTAGREEGVLVELPIVNVFVEQVTDFSAAVRDRSAPRVDAERGLRAVQVIAAAIESSRTGERCTPLDAA